MTSVSSLNLRAKTADTLHMSTISFQALARGIQRHEIGVLGKAASILENNRPSKSKLIKYLKSARSRKSGGVAIGITGSPGSGKSTLITALAKVMRRDQKTVAVVAVDPTSPKTGGAFLGDRVRMQELTEDSGVFIRSMASRGAQGGVARATGDVTDLFLKAGYDFVLVETVGTGQLDWNVTKIVDLTLLVLTPEAGDEMQFMKAGLGELVNGFVVNKSDRPGAQTMEDFLRRGKLDVPVFKTIAEQRKGIDPLYQFIFTRASSLRAKRSNL